MARRNFQKDNSTHKTIALLRETDRVMDAITSPSIWTKVKRELLYVAATVWQPTAIAFCWLVIFWILGSIIF